MPCPVPMNQALRPHRGGTVLALGILGLVIAVVAAVLAPMSFEVSRYGAVLGLLVLPIVIAAFLVGWRQVVQIRKGKVDPTGRTRIRTGLLIGMLAVVLGTSALSYVIAFSAGTQYELMSDGATSIVTEFYRQDVRKERYQVVRAGSGELVKDGPFVAWNREGEKVQEGSYHDGRREGQWTFWNEDGSIDLARSGIYENDVRVQEGARPAGY